MVRTYDVRAWYQLCGVVNRSRNHSANTGGCLSKIPTSHSRFRSRGILWNSFEFTAIDEFRCLCKPAEKWMKGNWGTCDFQWVECGLDELIKKKNLHSIHAVENKLKSVEKLIKGGQNFWIVQTQTAQSNSGYFFELLPFLENNWKQSKNWFYSTKNCPNWIIVFCLLILYNPTIFFKFKLMSSEQSWILKVKNDLENTKNLSRKVRIIFFFFFRNSDIGNRLIGQFYVGINWSEFFRSIWIHFRKS